MSDIRGLNVHSKVALQSLALSLCTPHTQTRTLSHTRTHTQFLRANVLRKATTRSGEFFTYQLGFRCPSAMPNSSNIYEDKITLQQTRRRVIRVSYNVKQDEFLGRPIVLDVNLTASKVDVNWKCCRPLGE